MRREESLPMRALQTSSKITLKDRVGNTNLFHKLDCPSSCKNFHHNNRRRQRSFFRHGCYDLHYSFEPPTQFQLHLNHQKQHHHSLFYTRPEQEVFHLVAVGRSFKREGTVLLRKSARRVAACSRMFEGVFIFDNVQLFLGSIEYIIFFFLIQTEA